MVAPPREASFPEKFSIERAEELLGCLIGVQAARVVARSGEEIQEIHVLTSDEVSPKQTVRNVESALAAHFNVSVDHRKISVAQAVAAQPEPEAETTTDGFDSIPLVSLYGQREQVESRFLFLGHQIETQRSQQVRVEVTLELHDEVFRGQAAGADVPRSRYSALASATLKAMEGAVTARSPSSPRAVISLSLDGIKVVDAFERRFVLVAVHAFEGREVTALTGACLVVDSPDRSVVMATLHATDRWVRGRI
jgi:hypothetical protein